METSNHVQIYFYFFGFLCCWQHQYTCKFFNLQPRAHPLYVGSILFRIQRVWMDVPRPESDAIASLEDLALTRQPLGRNPGGTGGFALNTGAKSLGHTTGMSFVFRLISSQNLLVKMGQHKADVL